MAVLTIQVLGVLGLFGIGMNAITAAVVTMGIGIGAKFTVHLSVVIAIHTNISVANEQLLSYQNNYCFRDAFLLIKIFSEK